IAAISVASRQERANGREKDNKQIKITEQTKRKVKESGNKIIQATGSSIAGDIPNTANVTDKCNVSETEPDRRTRPIITIL
ncbi:MAG: hypothetical protein DRJ13_09650, partial [Bacteroidetes bacterium]